MIPSVFGNISSVGNVPWSPGPVPPMNTGVKKELTSPLSGLPGIMYKANLVAAPAFASPNNYLNAGSSNAIQWYDEFTALGGSFLGSISTALNPVFGWTPASEDFYMLRQSPTYGVTGRLNLLKIAASSTYIPHFLVGISLISAANWANPTNFSGSGKSAANYTGAWTHLYSGVDTSVFVAEALSLGKEMTYLAYQSFNPNDATVNPNGAQTIAQFNASGGQAFGWFFLGLQNPHYIPSQYDGSVSVLSMTYSANP